MKSLLLCLVFCLSIAPSSAEGTDGDLAEANAHFRYQDAPIHPGLLKAFHNWESDYRPLIMVSVDVGAAFETNQFYETVEVQQDGTIGIELEDGGSFSYRHLGRVADGLHVLHTIHKWSGTGLSQSLTCRTAAFQSVWQTS